MADPWFTKGAARRSKDMEDLRIELRMNTPKMERLLSAVADSIRNISPEMIGEVINDSRQMEALMLRYGGSRKPSTMQAPQLDIDKLASILEAETTRHAPAAERPSIAAVEGGEHVLGNLIHILDEAKTANTSQGMLGLREMNIDAANSGGWGASLDGLASMGRDGDTEVVHVNGFEKAILESLGGRGSINPHTGLREYPPSWGGSNARNQDVGKAARDRISSNRNSGQGQGQGQNAGNNKNTGYSGPKGAAVIPFNQAMSRLSGGAISGGGAQGGAQGGGQAAASNPADPSTFGSLLTNIVGAVENAGTNILDRAFENPTGDSLGWFGRIMPSSLGLAYEFIGKPMGEGVTNTIAAVKSGQLPGTIFTVDGKEGAYVNGAVYHHTLAGRNVNLVSLMNELNKGRVTFSSDEITAGVGGGQNKNDTSATGNLLGALPPGGVTTPGGTATPGDGTNVPGPPGVGDGGGDGTPVIPGQTGTGNQPLLWGVQYLMPIIDQLTGQRTFKNVAANPFASSLTQRRSGWGNIISV